MCFLKKDKQDRIIAGELIGDKEFILNIKNLDYEYWINKVFTIDGLFYTEIGITSESRNWGIYLDNVDFEIGIIGFINKEQEKLFFDAFDKNCELFMSLDDYVTDMGLMLNFSDATRQKYNTIINNHRYRGV